MRRMHREHAQGVSVRSKHEENAQGACTGSKREENYNSLALNNPVLKLTPNLNKLDLTSAYFDFNTSIAPFLIPKVIRSHVPRGRPGILPRRPLHFITKPSVWAYCLRCSELILRDTANCFTVSTSIGKNRLMSKL